VLLITEAVNLCPEEEHSGGGELYLTHGDAVTLAQTSPSVAAAINWIKVERLAENEVRPRRRKVPQPPKTFPLPLPRLPTRMTPSAVAALVRIANLDVTTADAFAAVATAYVVTTWGRASDDPRDDAPTGTCFVAIVCGWFHSVGLRNDGTVVTWGGQRCGERRDAPTCGGFVAIACGLNHSVGLRNDGKANAMTRRLLPPASSRLRAA